MNEARILCVGDMHLGRRPSRLPEGAPADIGPRAAWKAVVETALAREVDAVLLAGDVVESRNGFMEAYGALVQGIRRLREKGIDVVAVAGNHDVEVLPRLADELEDFHLLGRGGRWNSHIVRRSGEALVRVFGWSFPSKKVESSPLDSLSDAQRNHEFGDDADDTLRTVGLLHCDLDANAGVYAPVSSQALTQLGLSAWFLGHIHGPTIKSGGRPLGYLGSLAALDPGEPGPHGPWLAQSTASAWDLEQLLLSPVRWEPLAVDVSPCRDSEAVQGALIRALNELHEALSPRFDGTRIVGLRARLQGETSLAPGELRDCLRAARELPLDAIDGVTYFFDKGFDDTTPRLDLEALARGVDPASLMARRLLSLEAGDDKAQGLIAAARERLLRAASHGNFQSLGKAPLDDERVRQLLVRTARRALAELLAQKVPRALSEGLPSGASEAQPEELQV